MCMFFCWQASVRHQTQTPTRECTHTHTQTGVTDTDVMIGGLHQDVESVLGTRGCGHSRMRRGTHPIKCCLRRLGPTTTGGSHKRDPQQHTAQLAVGAEVLGVGAHSQRVHIHRYTYVLVCVCVCFTLLVWWLFCIQCMRDTPQETDGFPPTRPPTSCASRTQPLLSSCTAHVSFHRPVSGVCGCIPLFFEADSVVSCCRGGTLHPIPLCVSVCVSECGALVCVWVLSCMPMRVCDCVSVDLSPSCLFHLCSQA